MLYDDTVWTLDVPKARSSLVRRVEFNETKKVLLVWLHHSNYPVSFENVDWQSYEDMCQSESIGKYYLHYIKPNFKQIQTKQMSEKRTIPGKNFASEKMRFIDISIDVRKIEKSWLVDGDSGTYLNLVLHLKPDGEVDKFENLGMVTQKVPKKVYEADKAIKGPILGNGKEIDWDRLKGNQGYQPGDNSGEIAGDTPIDDLPF